VVDAFGQLGSDPGTACTSGAVSTVNLTLRRKAAVTSGSVPPAEWEAVAIDSFDGLGSR
jgi:uncharacterized protein